MFADLGHFTMKSIQVQWPDFSFFLCTDKQTDRHQGNLTTTLQILTTQFAVAYCKSSTK
jgi:hypothetical protein